MEPGFLIPAGRLSLKHLMAGSAALLVDANLLVALGTAPEPTAFDFLFSRPKGHGLLLGVSSKNQEPIAKKALLEFGSWFLEFP